MGKTVVKCKNLEELAYYLRDCGMNDNERCDIQDMLMKRPVEDIVQTLHKSSQEVRDLLFWAIWGCLDKNVAHLINRDYYNQDRDNAYKYKLDKTLEDLKRVEEKLNIANANGQRENKYRTEAKDVVKFLLSYIVKLIGGAAEKDATISLTQLIKYCAGFDWLTDKDVMDAVLDRTE